MPFAVQSYEWGIPFIVKRDKTTTPGYIYTAFADPRTSTSAAKWRLQRETLGTDGDITDLLFAQGSYYFDKVWDLRDTYTYE